MSKGHAKVSIPLMPLDPMAWNSQPLADGCPAATVGRLKFIWTGSTKVAVPTIVILESESPRVFQTLHDRFGSEAAPALGSFSARSGPNLPTGACSRQ